MASSGNVAFLFTERKWQCKNVHSERWIRRPHLTRLFSSFPCHDRTAWPEVHSAPVIHALILQRQVPEILSSHITHSRLIPPLKITDIKHLTLCLCLCDYLSDPTYKAKLYHPPPPPPHPQRSCRIIIAFKKRHDLWKMYKFLSCL